jgi:hypothetical protein
MREGRSLLNVILHSVVSFIVLIVLLIIANILIPYVNNGDYLKFINFFNSLLGLFIILFLVGLINGIFWNLEFPLNILAPISGAVLGVSIVDLIYRILEFAQTFVYFDALNNLLSYNLRAIVFFATLVIGYLIIIIEVSKREEEYPREVLKKKYRKENIIEEKKDRKYAEPDFSWKEVGNEFKKVSLNVGKALNRAFEGKDKKLKKKKKN